MIEKLPIRTRIIDKLQLDLRTLYFTDSGLVRVLHFDCKQLKSFNFKAYDEFCDELITSYCYCNFKC